MNAPPPPQAHLPASGQTVQAETVPTDDTTLSDDKASDLVKSSALRYRIEQIIKQNEAQNIATSVEITDLRTGQAVVDYNSDVVQSAVSINKLPVALLLLEDLRAGKIHLGDTLAWQAEDVRTGFGVYDLPGAPQSATVQELVQDMLNRSGTTAVRILVNNTSLGGAEAVNTRLAQYPQLIQTRLEPVDASRFFLGTTTVGESEWIMEQILKTQDEYGQLMQHVMATNIFVSYGVRSQLEDNNYIVLANKVGILDDPSGNNRHDVGIIYNARKQRSFAYSIMTTNVSIDAAVNMQAEASLQQIGRDVLRFAGDKPAQTRTIPKLQTQSHAQPEKKVLY